MGVSKANDAVDSANVHEYSPSMSPATVIVFVSLNCALSFFRFKYSFNAIFAMSPSLPRGLSLSLSLFRASYWLTGSQPFSMSSQHKSS